MLIIGTAGEGKAVPLQEQQLWSIALPRRRPHGLIHPPLLETHGQQRQMNGPLMTHLRIYCLLSLYILLATSLTAEPIDFVAYSDWHFVHRDPHFL